MFWLKFTTWIELSRENLIHNVSLLKSPLPKTCKFLGVVKANAYGHGLKEVVGLLKNKVDFFGVHTFEEAQAVKALAPHTPILIMGFVPPDYFQKASWDKIHLLVSTFEVLEWLAHYQPRIPIHLKIETGTHRQGFSRKDLPKVLAFIQTHKLPLVGLATHFANIEDTTDHSFAKLQLRRFHSTVKKIKKMGFSLPWLHTACSAAILLFPETYGTLVRGGISLYGYWPSKETYLSWRLSHPKNQLSLKPVLTWKTVVGQIKEVSKGETVGYGCTWKALRKTRLAVLPIGYADGYDRHLSNRGYVLIQGKQAPVRGRVCMNIMMVDVTDIPKVKVGDEVILLGSQGEEEVTADHHAQWVGTINYEILARLNPGIPRIIQ